jgi:predicted amidohydrolase YtcJ
MPHAALPRLASVCLVVLLFPIAMNAADKPTEPADLVLLHGKVLTMDNRHPEATAVVVRGDRIAEVGDDTAARWWIGSGTRVIDLKGCLALPGFIDSHAHLIDLGETKIDLDLAHAKTWEEIVTLVKDAAKRAQSGKWIIGRGWHQGLWDRPPADGIEGYPHHAALSRAVPDNPVLLYHGTGHMVFANAKAMALAGVTKDTPNPPGGAILHDAAGNPTGAFREEASDLVETAYQRYLNKRTPEEVSRHLDEAIRLAADDCLSHGVTTFHDLSEDFSVIDHFRRLAEQGKLPLRLYVVVLESADALEQRLPQYRVIGMGKNHLTVRAVKMFMDGALGTHGAWFLEPYNDLPGSTGMNVIAPDTLRRVAKICLKYNFQLCVHAIGDRANRQVLDIMEEAFQPSGSRPDLRWRIEHAQHLNPVDIPRFRKLGVIASMQGCHATADAPFVVQRLGTKRAAEGAYAWRSVLDAGAMICNGTDAPVEPVDPIACFHASMTRKGDGKPAFFPEQRMTRQEALRSYTANGAYAGFEEDLKGSLTPGKLADIAVLSADIMTVPEEKIPHVRVMHTILGGKVVYSRPPR